MPVYPLLCREADPIVVGLDALQNKAGAHPTGKEIVSAGILLRKRKVHPIQHAAYAEKKQQCDDPNERVLHFFSHGNGLWVYLSGEMEFREFPPASMPEQAPLQPAPFRA